MSYREENGQVVLTMSRQDYEMILMALGSFTAMIWKNGGEHVKVVSLLNRLNEGNPNYTPYQVEQKK